ncbi:DEAD/DEAH box helicase [Pseudomonas aeruginosa]
MIAEVAKALGAIKEDEEGHREGEPAVVAVEAGTGTGKTVAYSLAAIACAKASGKRLVIATATVALQEQIVHKDLPDLLRNSGLAFSFALAKGRGRHPAPVQARRAAAGRPGAERDGATVRRRRFQHRCRRDQQQAVQPDDRTPGRQPLGRRPRQLAGGDRRRALGAAHHRSQPVHQPTLPELPAVRLLQGARRG